MEHSGIRLDVVTYNVLIKGLCAGGHVVSAVELYKEMKNQGLLPNCTTYTSLINAIFTKGSAINAETLLADLKTRGFSSWDGNANHWREDLVIAMRKIKYTS